MDDARLIVEEIGLPVYATRGTAERLLEVGVDCIAVEKEPGNGMSAFDVIDDGRVDLVINIPREYDEQGRPDGYLIRRRAVDAGIPLITDLKLAGAVVEALRSKRPHQLEVVAWDDYIGRQTVPFS